MNILVTGGAGFIGSHVTDLYIKNKQRVVVIDDLSSGTRKNVNPQAVFYKEDIRKKGIFTIIKKEKIDILNHHAAQIDVRKSVEDPVFDTKINIEGSLNIFEACRKNKIKKIIFASSGGAIYGDTDILPTPENLTSFKPSSPYGVAKLAVEYYLQYYLLTHRIPSIALRYSNVYGPRQDPYGEAGVVAIFSQIMIAGKQPIIHGDGKQIRDFVYVSDVAQSNVNAVEKDFVGAVNIATGEGTSVNKLFSLLLDITKSKSKEVHGPAKVGEQRRSVLSIKLANKVLDWHPHTKLRNGLKKTVAFFAKKR